MPSNKTQHFVPAFYFRQFSKDRKTICTFNIPNEKFIQHAPIKGQCSKDYFYSKNTGIEKVFSELEQLAAKKIAQIISNQSLSCLSKEEKKHLKSHILFQHGRTKSIFDRETVITNYFFDLLKPKIYQDAINSGEDISWDSIKECKIVLNLSHALLVSMLSGILLRDLEMVLLINQSKIDFIFSDVPVVLFNSFFNDLIDGGTTGIASTGLQIFYPLNSKLILFLYDSNFYELPSNNLVKLNKPKDIQRLNGLQVLNCDKNIYFKDESLKDKIIELYNQIKAKRPNKKIEFKVVGSRIVEDGTYRELLRTSAPKICYDLRKLSFLKHKKTTSTFGVRNPQLVDIHKKVVDAVSNGKIKSMSDLSSFLKMEEA